jgi:hypothetical protein
MLVLESGATEAGAAASVDVCVWSFFFKKNLLPTEIKGLCTEAIVPPFSHTSPLVAVGIPT